eukprot:3768710-Amphidinium_carterae.1
MRLCSKRLSPLRKAFLEGPALLPPQVGEVKLPAHFTRLPVRVQAPGKGGEGNHTSVRPFHVRSLRLGLPRSTQAQLQLKLVVAPLARLRDDHVA